MFQFILLGRDPCIRDHQPDLYWISSFIELKNKSLPELPLVESFQHLGFTRFRAQSLAGLIQENPTSDHQTLLYIAKRYIARHQHSSILFCKNSEQNGASANASATIKTDPRGDDNPVEIPVVPVDEEEIEQNEIINFYKTQSKDKLEETTFWFHGTSKESAMNIAAKGVNLKRGGERGDFSDGAGFYLTSNFDFAYNWARMNHEDGAVLVFKVHKELFQGGLELSKENTAKWEKVVSFFRNGCVDVKCEYLEDFNYIYGPISKDGNKSSKNPKWKPRCRSDPMGNHLYQVCLKDKVLAREFYNKGQNIEKVILLTK